MEAIKGKYFNVLDHGFIGLVDIMGDDAAIEQAARVSYQKGTRKKSSLTGLLRYLMRHHHLTPFEMVELKFHVKCPIFVMRQWIRHRTASVNEESGRYSVIREEFYTPGHEQYGLQSQDNKQGRSDKLVDPELYKTINEESVKSHEISTRNYNNMLEAGVAREIARIDLPVSTYTNFFWKCNLRNLFNFLSLRCDSHAQYEIRMYANIIAGIVKELCPIAFSGWYDYTFCARTLSRQDIVLLNYLINLDTNMQFLWSKQCFALCKEYGAEIGMSEREIDEFYDKLTVLPQVDFSLDFTKSFVFEEK